MRWPNARWTALSVRFGVLFSCTLQKFGDMPTKRLQIFARQTNSSCATFVQNYRRDSEGVFTSHEKHYLR